MTTREETTEVLAGRVDVLGVGISVTTIPHTLDTMDRWIESREQHYVCVTGVHGVMESQRDPELKRVHNRSGLTVPDGVPLLWAGRYAGAAAMSRVRGPDLLPAVAERAAHRGWRVFLYGGAEGTPELLAANLRARCPGLRIAGTYSPPFRALTPEEEHDVAARINASEADIVMVGLSTPKQERWMAWATGRIGAPVMFGFGAAFDIHAGIGVEAPRWVRPTGFEWLYRMARDPRRLGRRYLRNNPRFVASILRRPPRLRASRRRRTKRLAVALVGALERARVHALPVHFYSPVPERNWLRRNEELWRRPVAPHGTRWDLDDQLGWLEKVCAGHRDEVRGFPFFPELRRRGIDFRYGPIEAQVLHCAVRTLAPRRIVEIGSGASTALMSDAVDRNLADGKPVGRITTIDPYLSQAVRRLPHVDAVATPAQRIAAATIGQLTSGDLLFIDSTHVVKTGSELHRIYLELLPALAPGVYVHVHDIYLPYLYSPWILDDLWDWQETALLAALLTGNPRFEVLACQSALHHGRQSELRRVLPDYRPRDMDRGLDEGNPRDHFPSSIWLRTRPADAASTASEVEHRPGERV
ncbi:WecB/TagA/CpsF family glycosyltransferase [Haloechinothrix sp. LS1_15]|uniref:WecB/TagA/CpsF family glycosyltransferase n=1 Tax=Haloechinothrix sp. LS1_15 TaxID=2652248 RepID=UPI0029452864|nr:WecB/TagA/CpsF family glycosyltransferase [Haloechinothrix sp. LS1_15]MDV6013570.1 WecB/TagA/CpsF family glycosyltransferase [Haloechinothrix sp. LS1_15]